MSTELKKYERLDRITVKITYFLALIILVILLIWGIISLVAHWRYENTNDAQVQEYINPIVSRANGYVEEIHYTDHQQVHQGDTLIILDRDEALVQQKQAQAALKTAQAQLQVLISTVNTATSNTAISKANIDAANAELWKEEQEYQRYKNLLENEAVTQQRFENIETELKVAKAKVNAVKKGYEASKNQINDIEAQIQVAKAAVLEKEAVLNRIDLDLKYAVITAPADGYMGKKTIQAGQLIQKGQTIGFLVDQSQGKWIVANFEETQIANMQIGQPVNITIDAFGAKEFHGKIVSFSPATGSQFSLLPPDNATGNFVKITQRFPVRIQFTEYPNELQSLRAGMNAEVSVHKL